MTTKTSGRAAQQFRAAYRDRDTRRLTTKEIKGVLR